MVRTFILSLITACACFAIARWTAPPSRTIATISAPVPAPPAEAIPATPPTAPPAAEPARKRLAAAISRHSPLETARNAIEVIDSMTAQDFQSLGDEPGRVPIPSAGSYDQEFCNAFMDTLVERWLEVDPAGALAGIHALEKKLIIGPGQLWSGSGEFINGLARVRPEMLLAALPDGASWKMTDRSVPTAFTALAGRDPAAARTFLAHIGDPDRRREGEIAIAIGIANTDPVAAVSLAREMKSEAIFSGALGAAEDHGAETLRAVLEANDRQFPVGFQFAELVLRHPDIDWSALASDSKNTGPHAEGVSIQALQEAGRIPAEERLRRLNDIDRLPESIREKVANALINAWTTADPESAAAWTFEHANNAEAGEDEIKRARGAFSQWRRADEDAAVAWWSRQPASSMRDRIGNILAMSRAATTDWRTATSLFRPDTEADAANFAFVVASSHAKVEPAAVAEWIEALPSSFETAKAAVELIGTWFSSDPGAAAAWAEAQPDGPRREAALTAYARAASAVDPAAASAWTETIADPVERAKAAEYVFRKWDQRDPVAAAQWLRALPGVDEKWRERFLRLGL